MGLNARAAQAMKRSHDECLPQTTGLHRMRRKGTTALRRRRAEGSKSQSSHRKASCKQKHVRLALDQRNETILLLHETFLSFCLGLQSAGPASTKVVSADTACDLRVPVCERPCGVSRLGTSPILEGVGSETQILPKNERVPISGSTRI